MPYIDTIALGFGESICAARYAQRPPALVPATAIASSSTQNLKLFRCVASTSDTSAEYS
ncbi:hypothetical protein H0H93_006001, partial [Arthromyces matolae]